MFPFQTIAHEDGQFSIEVFLENEAVFQTYAALFQKYQLPFDGYLWQRLLIFILEKENKTMLLELDFDSETDLFAVYAESLSVVRLFEQTVCPIFSDLEKLETYIKNADKSRIDD